VSYLFKFQLGLLTLRKEFNQRHKFWFYLYIGWYICGFSKPKSNYVHTCIALQFSCCGIIDHTDYEQSKWLKKMHGTQSEMSETQKKLVPLTCCVLKSPLEVRTPFCVQKPATTKKWNYYESFQLRITRSSSKSRFTQYFTRSFGMV